MKSGKLRVAIIDSGIDVKNPFFTPYVSAGVSIDLSEDGSMVVSNDYTDQVGHGTAVAGIVARECIEPVELYIIKVFHDELTCSIEALIYALEYASQNFECDFINLSLGVSYSTSELYDACKKIVNNNKVIISAYDNTGSISFPAAYSDLVIGVDSAPYVIKNSEFISINNGIVGFWANGYNQRVLWKDSRIIINQGSSFACAHMTANIVNANILEKNNDLSHEKQIAILNKCSKSAMEVDIKRKNSICMSVKKTAILGYTKETSILIKFKELLSFDVIAILETKYSGKIGKEINNADTDQIIKIINVEEFNFNLIDTLIVCHTKELNLLTDDYFDKILCQIRKENPNILIYELDRINCHNNSYCVNELQNRDFSIYEKSKMNKLFKVKAPVIGIFGTSSKQGKYTLQLSLQKIFQDKGYAVGLLGSEPTAALFGGEMYHFGYGADLPANIYEFVDDLNTQIHILDSKNSDIIIVGCQSGSAPMVWNNMNQLQIPQTAFALGTLPDVFILVVNYNDNIYYIMRSIKMLEGLSGGKVIALAVFPYKYKNNWFLINGMKVKALDEEVDQYIEHVKHKTGLPIFKLNEENDNLPIVEYIINFLAE